MSASTQAAVSGASQDRANTQEAPGAAGKLDRHGPLPAGRGP